MVKGFRIKGLASVMLAGVFCFCGAVPVLAAGMVRSLNLRFEDQYELGSGSGWTGQPLMEKWSREVKKSMNMYDWAKEKDDLVEVIYACMDGYVYFLDLETGEATRDPNSS